MTIPGAVIIVMLLALLSAITVSDLRAGLIRNLHNAILAGLGLAFRYVEGVNVWAGLVGGLIGCAVLLAANIAYNQHRGRDGFGYGDVKFMFGAGVWTGWEGIAPLLLISSLLGLVAAAIAGPREAGPRLQTMIRFGPYLAAGLLIVLAIQQVGLAPWVIQ